jgi:hypothetical protein
MRELVVIWLKGVSGQPQSPSHYVPMQIGPHRAEWPGTIGSKLTDAGCIPPVLTCGAWNRTGWPLQQSESVPRVESGPESHCKGGI